MEGSPTLPEVANRLDIREGLRSRACSLSESRPVIPLGYWPRCHNKRPGAILEQRLPSVLTIVKSLVQMHLYISHSPFNSVYTNESGQGLYKVKTKLSGRTSTITRSIPNDIPQREAEANLPDRFAHLAQIDWRIVESTKIRFAGTELDIKTLFRKGSWERHGRCVRRKFCSFRMS